MSKIRILNTEIDKLTQSDALSRIGAMIEEQTPHYIVTANAEIAYMAYHDEKMQQAVNGADMVTADGSGILWAAKQLGDAMPERVTGIDLVYAICKESAVKGWKIYLMGSAEGVAQKAAHRLMLDYVGCNIVGTHHGFLKEKAVEQALIEDIKAKQPDVLLVGMGAPRQEYWIIDHMEELGVPVSMGIGGSMDVISGELKRAPKWMQKMSLEWLYRLIKQPSRIGRMMNLPKFMLAVKRSKKQG